MTCASRDHFVCYFVVQCDEYLFTEVEQQWATLVLGSLTDLVHYLCL